VTAVSSTTSPRTTDKEPFVGARTTINYVPTPQNEFNQQERNKLRQRIADAPKCQDCGGAILDTPRELERNGQPICSVCNDRHTE
jgi:formylmethanofuran dehydrogenase subunit E